MIGKTGRKHLGLIFQAPERAGVHDAVAIALKVVAIRMWKFGIAAAAAAFHWKPEMGESARNQINERL